MSIKDFLFNKVEEEEPKFIPPASSPQPVEAYQPSYTDNPGYAPADEKLQAHFQGIFNSLNDPKPSYHEFIAMQKSMQGALGRDQSFRIAFQGCSAQGLTKDVLVQTTEHTLTAIRQHLDEYNRTVRERLETQVEGQKKLLIEKKRQLEQIQLEISNLEASIHQDERKITGNSAAYNAYGSSLISSITEDLNSINQLL